ncbi:MAG: hypothetical protein AAFO07_29435 [Bacteroidota bacterium]
MYITPDIPNRLVVETLGNSTDLQLLKEDKWLMDTEVRYYLIERRSRWHLTMTFIDVDNSLKFICRKIDSYHSEQKAQTFAKIMQRGIRKDARGVLKSNRDAFNICNN